VEFGHKRSALLLLLLGTILHVVHRTVLPAIAVQLWYHLLQGLSPYNYKLISRLADGMHNILRYSSQRCTASTPGPAVTNSGICDSSMLQ